MTWKWVTNLSDSLKGVGTIPPMFIDGVIALCIAFLTSWETTFGGDEAAKYISPIYIFWLKSIIGSIAIALVTLQSFRSRSYANHLEAKKNGNTDEWRKQQVAAEAAKSA